MLDIAITEKIVGGKFLSQEFVSRMSARSSMFGKTWTDRYRCKFFKDGSIIEQIVDETSSEEIERMRNGAYA